jgi:chromosome partitioning protein
VQSGAGNTALFHWGRPFTRVPMAQITAIANQKGGVGKTTTAINLSACLAAAGRSVLLVDLDPQGNATSGLGIDKNSLEHTLYDAMVNGHSLSDLTCETLMEKLHVVPSNRDLVGAEVELVDMERREYRLRHALHAVKDRYDYILIDCPPSLSLLTLNGLAAADSVLITLQCEYYALEGLSELLQTVKLVRDSLNPALKLDGVLLTMYQRTNLSNQVIEDVRAHLGDRVYQTVIPRNVTLSEAPSFGKPVIFYDLKSAGARAYLALAREVVSRG